MTGKESTATRISDYRLGGQLLLWAARHWIRAYRRGTMVQPCVWQSFAAAGLGGAYAELCRLMRIVVFRELDVSSVRGPGASRLSAAERQFMSLFERIEENGPDAARTMAESFTTPAVAREIVAIVAGIVDRLADEGHRIATCSAAWHGMRPISETRAVGASTH
jgi:hypothetical protein